MPSLVLDPIGFVRNALSTKVDAARQPRATAGTPARIELLPGRNFEHALEDLGRWELVWVLFWFHQNAGWRPKILPPRSTTGRKGVFATRSPHRPNPIGMSVVRLERVDGLTLHISDADMLDGTPVLDLKPYVAYTDAHPRAGNGWLEDGGHADTDARHTDARHTDARHTDARHTDARHTDARHTDARHTDARPSDPLLAYLVEFDALATEQTAWIETRTGFAIGQRILSTLALGPAPHPYRRIRRMEDCMQLSVKEWRVRFSVVAHHVRVIEIRSGFRPSQLAERGADEVRRWHREFLAQWPRKIATWDAHVGQIGSTSR